MKRPLGDFSFENEMRLGLFGEEYMFMHDERPSMTRSKRKIKTITTLFKYSSLKNTTWILLVFWILLTVANHGDALSLDHFSNDPARNLINCGAIELVGFTISCYLAFKYPRKAVLGISLLLTGLMYILLFAQDVMPGNIDIEETKGKIILVLVIGRISISVAYGTLYTMVAELFPTSVRHFSFGFYNAMSYICVFLLLIIADSADDMKSVSPYPCLVMGVACVVVVYLIKSVKETVDQKIKDYIREEDESLLNYEMRERE